MDTAAPSVLCLQVVRPSAESRWSTSSARLRKDPLIFLSRCARASNSRSSVLHCDHRKPRKYISFMVWSYRSMPKFCCCQSAALICYFLTGNRASIQIRRTTSAFTLAAHYLFYGREPGYKRYWSCSRHGHKEKHPIRIFHSLRHRDYALFWCTDMLGSVGQ